MLVEGKSTLLNSSYMWI